MIRVVALLLFIISSTNTYALSDKSFDHGLYWGDREEKAVKKKPKHKTSTYVVKPSYREINKAITEELDELKAKAVLEPTVENVSAYITMQNKVVRMSTQFGEVWQQALLTNPELDYSASHPSSNFALTERTRLKKAGIEQTIAMASKVYGLVYVYNGRDPMSKLEVPILTRFSQKYSFTILGVSLDGELLEGINNARNVGQIDKLGVQVTPALVALNVRTKEALPVHYGLIAEVDLEDKLGKMLQQIGGFR